MRALKITALGCLVAVLAFLAVGLALPNDWHVEKSIVVRAPPETLHGRVKDLRTFRTWGAWDVDPQAQWEFGGQDGQIGSWMSWRGPQIGRGKMTLDTVLPEKIIALEAIESDDVNARSVWTFQKNDDGTTTVKWVDEGKSPLIVGGYMKGMLEDVLSRHVQSSLENLKRLAEAGT